jgi:hypothetical protein
MEAEAALRQELDQATAQASAVERENVALREKVSGRLCLCM